MPSEFEERFEELTNNKSVVGAMILTAEGKTVRTTFDSASSSNYAEFAYKLIKTTRELLQETDSGNDVKLFHWGQVAIDIFLWQIQAQGNIISNNFT